MNAEQRLLQALENHPEGLTKPQIWQEVSIWNVGDIVMKLRKKGYEILTDKVKSKNKYGEAVSFGRYRLGGE